MKNHSSTIISFRRSNTTWLISYLFIASLFYTIPSLFIVLDNQKEFNHYDIWIIIGICYSLFGVWLSQKLKISSIISLILITQISLSLILQQYIIESTGGLFYSEAVDAILYSEIAMQIKDLSLYDSIEVINNQLGSISDLGAPLYFRLIYKLGGNVEISMRLLSFTNSFLQTLTAVFTYRLADIVFNNKEISKFTLALWGFNICSVFFNISGLKEPLFCLISTLAMYYTYRYHISNSLKNLLLFIIFASCTLFFRFYMTIFYIIIFVGYNFFSKIFNKFYILWCLLSISVVIFFPLILQYFIPDLSYTIDIVEANKPQGIMLYVYYLLTCLAPLPKFFSIESTASIIITAYSYVKFSFSIFTMIGIYFFIKHRKTNTYPLILISLFCILLLIFAGAYIDYRFSYIIMPCFFILMIGGGLLYQNKLLSVSYLVVTSVITYIFNLGLYK